MIRTNQEDFAQLCELADFIDSGFQSYREQVQHLSPTKNTEAAFYAGAGLAMKLMEHFSRCCQRYPPHATDYLAGLVVQEINEYMERNGMKLEWEPHVPKSLQQ